MKRPILSLALLLSCTGCNLIFGSTIDEPKWYDDDDAVSDDACSVTGGSYAPEAPVEYEHPFSAGGRRLAISCGTLYAKGYFEFWRPDDANLPDPNEEYLVSVAASTPFVVWKTEIDDRYCGAASPCALGELMDGEYRAELTVTPKTRFEGTTSVIGLGTIEDSDTGSATIRVTKLSGYGAGGAGGVGGAAP